MLNRKIVLDTGERTKSTESQPDKGAPRRLNGHTLSTGTPVNLGSIPQLSKPPELLLGMRSLRTTFTIDMTRIKSKAALKSGVELLYNRIKKILNIVLGIDVDDPVIMILENTGHKNLFKKQAPPGVRYSASTGYNFVYRDKNTTTLALNFYRIQRMKPEKIMQMLIHELVGIAYISAPHCVPGKNVEAELAAQTYDYSLIAEGWCCLLSEDPYSPLLLYGAEKNCAVGNEAVLTNPQFIEMLKERHFFSALALLKIHTAFGQDALYEYFTKIPGQGLEKDDQSPIRLLEALYRDYSLACKVCGDKPIPKELMLANGFAESY